MKHLGTGTGLALVATVTLSATPAGAIGEEVDGFPNWAERVMHQLTNRARVAPELEMAECGSDCAEAACYEVNGPLYYLRELNLAARFHADAMEAMGDFAHASACTLVDDIATLYPDSCDGSASCACVGGVAQCSPECTGAGDRVRLWGIGWNGEIIASNTDPQRAFYGWLYEDARGDSTCEFTTDNGHRWLILTANGSVGFGSTSNSVGDFNRDDGEIHRIASGAHWPQEGPEVEVSANWYDSAGPGSALVNVAGECTALELERGAPENGTYHATLSGVSGCQRYYFVFEDSAGQLVTFPTTGSLGIGPAGSCETWSDERPTTGASCSCTPSCDAIECGDDTCGGSCGNCAAGESCEAGACVPDDTGAGGSTTGSGGSITATGGSTTGSGGSGGSTTGSGGAPATSEDSDDDGGCGCRAARRSTGSWLGACFALLGLVLLRRRRP